MVSKFHVNIPVQMFHFSFAKFVGIYHVTLFCELLIFVVVVVFYLFVNDNMGLCCVAERQGIKAITVCGTPSSCDFGGW